MSYDLLHSSSQIYSKKCSNAYIKSVQIGIRTLLHYNFLRLRDYGKYTFYTPSYTYNLLIIIIYSTLVRVIVQVLHPSRWLASI